MHLFLTASLAACILSASPPPEIPDGGSGPQTSKMASPFDSSPKAQLPQIDPSFFLQPLKEGQTTQQAYDAEMEEAVRSGRIRPHYDKDGMSIPVILVWIVISAVAACCIGYGMYLAVLNSVNSSLKATMKRNQPREAKSQFFH